MNEFQAVAELSKQKDNAYMERNRLVALLARLFPSGTAESEEAGWRVVYIDSPLGQLSWHYNDAQAPMFESLPPYKGAWDGHSTELKYHRIEMLSKMYDTRRGPAVSGT